MPESAAQQPQSQVALLTGGGDRPYAHGLALSLAQQGLHLDFIGSDFLESPVLRSQPRIRFLNLRGDARADAPLIEKVLRVIRFYYRLLRYVTTSQPRVLHILWNNRLEYLDRTLLLMFYRLLGKRVVFTVHNVNTAARDNRDSRFNRATLRFQYQCVDHLFVHTELMKEQLCREYGVRPGRISVVPFGINDTSPLTSLDGRTARARLGVDPLDRCVLFFGNIAPYKGLEYLVQAISLVRADIPGVRLLIAGRTKGSEAYWQSVRSQIDLLGLRPYVTERIEFIPDEDIEIYFKAADVLALPYADVFQSGVLFLGYNFGLPVIASDIASFRDDIIEGQTGFVCPPGDPAQWADALRRFFASDLYLLAEERRGLIRKFAQDRHSWTRVAEITHSVYCSVDACPA